MYPKINRKIILPIAMAIFIAVASGVMINTKSDAQQLPMNVRIAGNYTPLGYCQLVTSAATRLSGCTGGIPSGALYVELCSEGVALRYRDDGSTPTASSGMPVVANTCFQYSGYPLTGLFIIGQSAAATIDANFFQ